MNFPQFFIGRPILAIVISLIILIAGAVSLPLLPVSEYPSVVPPSIVVRASFPGANPKDIAKTVTSPLEEAITGVEGMLYMSSESIADGTTIIKITFESSVDLNDVQALVQNRVNQVLPQLPQTVQRIGVTTKKTSSALTLVVNLISPNDRYGMSYLSNYAHQNIKNQLKQVEGVGDVVFFGVPEYSMRVWLDPEKLAALGLTPLDVIGVIKEQNKQVAAGTLGLQPLEKTSEFQLLISTGGQLSTKEEFESIVVKVEGHGETVFLRDVANVELGLSSYTGRSFLNNKIAVAIGIFQSGDSDVIKVSNRIRKRMDELKESFPEGVDYRIAFDETIFIRSSITSVVKTLLEAILLVVIVVILFLQTWRAAIIPLVAVPVSIMGTFAVMHLLGFSLNNLTLFGFVVAIGIIVDDAIVVVENVERNMSLGLSPFEATQKAMREVTRPILATSLVLVAVFVPTAFISGIAGKFYSQFALTITISTLISALCSLTLSPALSVLLLKPKKPKDDERIVNRWVFLPFNVFFNRASESYTTLVKKLIRFRSPVIIVYVLLVALTYVSFKSVPTDFIPKQDKQYLVAFARLPNASSIDRTEEVVREMTEIALNTPGVASVVSFPGASIQLLPQSNSGVLFVVLKSFSERKSPDLSAAAIAGSINREFSQILGTIGAIFPPPPVRGLSTIGGFRLNIQDRSDQGFEKLFDETTRFIEAGSKVPGIARIYSNFQINSPQLNVDVSYEKAKSYGVKVSDIYDTLQIYLGSFYVNNFNMFGKNYTVKVQAGHDFRLEPDQILQFKVKNSDGEMIPLGLFVDISYGAGTDRVMHYNGYPSADITGSVAPGFSSVEAQNRISDILSEMLPNGMGFEWTGLAYQQRLSSNSAFYIFPLAIFLVFLILAAQYESWILPLVVVLMVPLTLLSAMLGVLVQGGNNNIFTQIGLIVLIGLACKNAILIVEFAKTNQENGMDKVTAILESCRLRLRPIIMTSAAFILGVVPLVLSTGAGSEMRNAMGVAVFSGMIGVTIFGLFLTPASYVILQRCSQKKLETGK